MSFKGAIFDLDGVIVDTVPLHFKGWKKMFGEYGKNFTFDDYKAKVDGIPRIDGARAILPDLPPDELDKAATRKQSYFLEFLKEDGISVYDTTRRLIVDLRAKGIKIAVISSSKNCPYILDKGGMMPLVDAMISGLDILPGKGKPDPWIFLTAMEKIGLKPEECVVFEDAVLGVEAGKLARMKTVGVDRHDDPGRLSKADIIVKDLGELNYAKLKALVESVR
jgi:beta-phosphoglucomutase